MCLEFYNALFVQHSRDRLYLMWLGYRWYPNPLPLLLRSILYRLRSSDFRNLLAVFMLAYRFSLFHPLVTYTFPGLVISKQWATYFCEMGA